MTNGDTREAEALSNERSALKLEYYRHVLDQIDKLNSNNIKLLTFFHFSATAIGIAGAAVYANRTTANIPMEVVGSLILFLNALLILVSLYVVATVSANILSWLDYRNEEHILLESSKAVFRKKPSLKNFWRWHETYILFFIIIFTGSVSYFVYQQFSSLIMS